jgi:hypothetical protein
MKKICVIFINIFLFTSIVFAVYYPPGYKGAEKDNGESLSPTEEKYVLSQTRIALVKLANCDHLSTSEKELIRSGKKTFYWRFGETSDPKICAGYDGVSVFSGGTVIYRVQIEYLNGGLNCCCKNPLWQTLGHEIAHIYFTGNPYGSGNKLSECKAYWLEENCLGKVIRTCDDSDCGAPDKTKCDAEKEFTEWVKEHDQPDENYSFSNGIDYPSVIDKSSESSINSDFGMFSIYPEIALLNKKSNEKKEILLKYINQKYFDCISLNEIVNNHKIMFIPTGELFGEENSNLNREFIRQFVANGGTLLVFAQQYGSHIDNVVPIPEGQGLRSYGWREDQSCMGWAGYFNQMHPVLASQTSKRVSINVDGYFDTYPSNATVLLRRVSNQQPCLISYPYGNGTVILTSMYTDWGAAHSQASSSELRLVRDLVTFAKNPNLAIPMFNLHTNFHPDISLNVAVKNEGENAVSKAKIKIYTPDRKTVLYETEAAIALASGADGVIPISFNLSAALYSDNYGLCHTDYELYDAEDNLVQMATETDSGRFGVHGNPSSYSPAHSILAWLTVENESIFSDEQPVFTLHVQNNTSSAINPSFNIERNHQGPQPLFSMEVPTNGNAEKTFAYEHQGAVRYWVTASGIERISKGIQIKHVRFENSLKTNNYNVGFSNPISFQLSSTNVTGKAVTGNIELKLLKGTQEIETLYSQVHEFGKDENFAFSGSQIPTSALTTGYYRLNLNVTGFDGKAHSSYASFSYFPSEVAMYFASMPEKSLIPGQLYAIGFKIKNKSNFKINEGKYVITLKSTSGVEEFRKEVTGVAFNELQELSFSETLNFAPVEKGKHQLQILYTDETGTSSKLISEHQYLMWARLAIPKSSYAYGEAIPLTATFNGAGQFLVKIAATGCDFSYEDTVELNAGNNFTWSQQFDIPITVANSMYLQKHFRLTVKDLSTYCEGASYTGVCSRETVAFVSNVPLKLDANGTLTLLGAQAGGTVDLALNIKSVSGFIVPLTGNLTVAAGSLNFTETRAVSISPGVDNPFTFQISVPASIDAGTYSINMNFIAEGRTLLPKVFPIYIPAPGMKLSEPLTTIAAGAALPLDFVNDGGKDGNYALELTLKDELGKVMLTHAGTQAIAAGATYHLDLTVPDGLKSGKYTLKQVVGETVSGKSFALQSGITLSGLTATLNAFTLKPAYFDNETVAGKTEIVAGGAIDNGKLKAKIVKTGRGGITVSEPGRYAEFIKQEAIDGQSVGNEIYFVTGTGLIALDRTSGKQKMIYEGEGLYSVLVTSSGELWLSSNEGVKRRKTDLNWITYTTADGLLSDNAWGFVEKNSDQSIWMATSQGISVFKNEAWNSFTTVDGLSSNYIWGLVKDSEEVIWVYSEVGLDRYNGSGFENVDIPFNPQDGYFIEAGSNGDIWSNTWDSTSEKIWRYAEGNWTNWDLTGLAPDSSVYDMAADDGEMWFSLVDWSSNEYFLMKFDGTFAIIQNTTIPLYTIIPDPGQPGIFMGSFPGYVELSAGSLTQHVIEIDKEKLLGEVTLLAGDGKGGTWAASMEGISYFNGSSFTHYPRPDIDISWNIHAMAAGPDGTAYAVINHNLLYKIDQAGLTAIPNPEGIEVDEWTAIGLTNNGRLWLIQDGIGDGRPCFVFNYDGAWHDLGDQFGWISNVRKIISDGSGGVWISWGSGLSDGTRLVHVGNDFSTTEYSTENSDLAYDLIEDICLDANGVLWILSGESPPVVQVVQQVLRTSQYYWEAVQTLQNGTFTLKASKGPEQTTPGYPDNGIHAILEAGAGDVVFAGADGGNAFHLYHLGNDELTASEELFYSDDPVFASSKGMIYACGDLETSGINNLLQIGSGLNSVQVWSSEYPVNAIAGAALNLDLLPAKTLEAGNYKLSAELSSVLDQELANSDYGFIVRGTAVAASISRSGSSDANVRNGSDAAVQFEVLNSTTEDKAGLNLKVSKVSPSGVETVLQDGPLSLNAGQSHSEELTFNESENGIWKLAVEVQESGTLLSSAELLLDVSEPAIAYEIVYPEYAGDESFPVKIKLSNSGKIATNVHVTAGAVLEPPNRIDEDVVLVPGEERMLSFSDTITAERVYDIAISGDLTINEQKTVAYGYVGNVALSVLPQYREGSVTMGYTVANSGGLPFSDTLHFGIYLADTETAVFTFDKTYNLYPAAEAIADALEFPLVPGPYQLRWTSAKSGSGQASFAILPAGSGQLAFAPAVKYPIGLADFAYTLANTDTVAGNIDLLIEIVPAAGGAPVYTLNKSHYLEAGANISDMFSCDFAGIGSYIVRISGAKVSGGTVSMPVKVLNLDEVTTSVVVQPASNGTIPVQVQVANSGYNDFAGTLVIEAGGLRHEEPLQVLSEATLSQVYGFDANGLTSGSHEVRTIIYDAAGNILSQNTLTVAVSNADIKVSEVPQNLTIAAGSFANVTLKVRNDGNKRGEAEIAMTAFDTLRETRTLTLEAGEEIELTDIFIDVDGDIPAGRYPCDYTLSGFGVANGLAKGNFTFQVTGIALNVSAALDRSLYNQGETAHLTIDVSANDPVTAPLEAVVNWNDFSERRSFTLDSGSSSLVFEIPLVEASDAKVFYGIYQQEGRGIYLNDIYLNFAGGVSVTLDQQVYAPGDSIHALFAVSEAGSLTAECFGQSQTIVIGTSGSINFAVPVDALGGSYGVSWTFTPTDAGHETLSGAKPFDVSGLVVKVAKAELERGKYAPGDAIKAMLNLESNRDISLSLRSWTVTPEAAWTYMGEQSIALSATQQTSAVMQYTFATTEAGTHRFVYGLYNGEQIVVSGAAAFDCGDAVLIGLAPNHLEYPLGSETVKVKADYFGSGTATLQLFLDDVVADEKSITLAGLGSTEIDLTTAQVSGGRHNLRAVISKDGLTSTRRAWFTYGTNLPDLAVGIGERAVNGLDYVFNVQVFNSGKTASPATTLVFSDNGTDMQSAAIGGLAPGTYQDVQFTWSGSGKAGSHALAFAVDRDNAVKEFAEGNNVLEINEEVPALFYKLEIDPQVWTANRTVSIFSRFINNQASDLPLALHLTLTHNHSSQVVLARDKNVTLTPFVQTLETDLFQTGIYPAGDYTLAQTASGGSVERTEELAVYIEPTKAISGTMNAVPATVAAGTDSEVTLKLSLRNEGNVALSDEALTVEVTNEEGQEVKTDTLNVSLAQGENRAIDHILSLNLAEGAYTITLKHGDGEIAETTIMAMSGLEKEKYVSRRPRLLFMNTHSNTYNSQKRFLKAVLNAAGIPYQDTGNLIESYFHDQKSEHNINVVFGKLATQSLKKELKERVHRGEGLIHFVDNPASDAVMEELSGVRARILLPALREKAITLLPGILGSGGSALLKEKCKLGLEILEADVLAVVETKNGKKPLAAYRAYGNGKVLTISLPLEFTSGGGFAQLLLNAVQLLNNDVFSPSDLARVLPLDLRIKNNTGAAKTFRVQELIPQAANAYGFNPQPLDGDGVKWDIQLAVDEEKTISYWLRLPDAIGTFDVKSEIFDGAQKVDEALLTFEVGQKIADRAAGIAAEIAAGDDSQAKQALPMLQRIASRSGEDPVSLLLNLVDAVQAADLVAASATAEAMSWRRSLQDLLMACARMFYDKVKDFTPLELNAFGTRFAE